MLTWRFVISTASRPSVLRHRLAEACREKVRQVLQRREAAEIGDEREAPVRLLEHGLCRVETPLLDYGAHGLAQGLAETQLLQLSVGMGAAPRSS